MAEQNTALWLRLIERNAEHLTVPPLRARALRKAARTIPAMTNLAIPDGFIAARAALAETGVALTFIREVPGTRVCGATWWLAADQPVMGLRARLNTQVARGWASVGCWRARRRVITMIIAQ